VSNPYDATQHGPPFPWWWNFWWLGPVQIPPLPARFGMTDRADGTVWYPSISNDGTHIVFSTAAPNSSPIKIYAAYDGPYVGQYGLRLGINSGRVVVDVFPNFGAGPFLQGVSSTTIAAVFFAQTLAPGVANGYDHLAFQSAPTLGSIFDPTP